MTPRLAPIFRITRTTPPSARCAHSKPPPPPAPTTRAPGLSDGAAPILFWAFSFLELQRRRIREGSEQARRAEAADTAKAVDALE
jgi:hypothetical protein